MENNNCTNGHQYGLWQIKNEKEVSRTCQTCKHQQLYPMTSEVLKEIKQQQQAQQLVTNFLFLPNDDINLIGYLNIILEDTLNYINEEKKLLLINKLTSLIQSTILTEENKTILAKFISSIKENNQQEIITNIEYFQYYNNDILTCPPITKATNLSK